MRCRQSKSACAVFEASFPYQAQDQQADPNIEPPEPTLPCGQAHAHTYRIDGWGYLNPYVEVPSVQEIKQAIQDHGPVAAAVCSMDMFAAYTGGVFDSDETDDCLLHYGQAVNHGIVLVGWVDDGGAGDGYWILKNSWGPGWGEGGYMRIHYGTSRVGYAANIVEFSNCSISGPEQPHVSIAATIPTASEQGILKGKFTVTRTGDLSRSVSVAYAVGGSASAGRDYYRLRGAVRFPANTSSVDVWVTPLDDTIFEGDETVEITLLKGSSYLLDAPASAVVTIVDNDPPPRPVVSITVADGEVSESGGDTGLLVVSRSGDTSKSLVVRCAVGGSARNGIDYLFLPRRVTIPAGQSSATIVIIPRGDSLAEGSETVTVTLLGSANCVVDSSNSAATVTISDNE